MTSLSAFPASTVTSDVRLCRSMTTVVQIAGESYRLKDKRLAGILATVDARGKGNQLNRRE